MGYKMPIVCKEIYLPLDYDWIFEHAGEKSFADFSADYKAEYGVDLHDLFKLRKNDDNLYVLDIKTPSKIYSVGVGGYPDLLNKVMMGVFDRNEVNAITQSILTIAVFECSTSNQTLYGYGFSVRLSADNLTPKSMDELVVDSYEL